MNTNKIAQVEKLMGFEKAIAAQEGKAAIQAVREALQRTLRELDSHEGTFDARADHPDLQADVLGWIIGAVTNNILGNTRMDGMSRVAAKLQALAARQEVLKMLQED